MAVTSKMYGLAIQSLFNKEIDFDTDTVKVMLLTSGYAPNQDTHRYVSDLVPGTNEVVGTGYVARGVTLTGKTVAYDGATNTLTLDCNDVTWNPSSITARYAVFYVETAGADATDPLLCYWDFGADVTSIAGPFTLTIAATGLVTATAA